MRAIQFCTGCHRSYDAQDAFVCCGHVTSLNFVSSEDPEEDRREYELYDARTREEVARQARAMDAGNLRWIASLRDPPPEALGAAYGRMLQSNDKHQAMLRELLSIGGTPRQLRNFPI